jgi:hypothetical protein
MSAATVEVDLDPLSFATFAVEHGWADGLPCIPPTPDLVATYLAATSRDPQQVLAVLPPLAVECTVERVAICAAMTAAPVEAMDLLCSSIEAMTVRDFNLASVNATTAPIVPALIVNGGLRHRLDIPYGAGCLGGALGSSAAIGRALRLVMRAVAGQRIGQTSECVFGQPARVSGLVFGEWEERSPWPSLAERRGVSGDAVTVFGAMGTQNICDTIAERATSLLRLIGLSIAYHGSNAYVAVNHEEEGEIVIAINPIWASEVIAKQIPDFDEVAQLIWESAKQPLSSFPEDYRAPFEDLGRVDNDGNVPVVRSPKKLLLTVAGGEGALHAMAFHGFGHNLASTVAVGPGA